MRGSRLFAIILGLLGLIILVIVVAVLLLSPGGTTAPPAATAAPAVGEAEEVEEGPTTTPEPAAGPMVEVVVSLQTVPRGWQMTEAELTTELRLAAEVGSNVLTRLSDAVGLYARHDIYQGETLTTDTLVRDPTLIAAEEYGPSALVPQGWVAMSVPTDRLSSVAYALQPGDTVDLMLTFTLNAIDEEFQTLLSNSATFYLQTGEGEAAMPNIFVIDPYGRFERLPTNDIAHIAPSEDPQRPIPVAVILQNARVISVGPYLPPLPVLPPTPTPAPNEPTPTPGGGPPPTPTPAPPDVVLLALPPQQQLFVNYALAINADIDLALRGVNDLQLYASQNVDLNYLLQRFNIDIPPDASFAIGGLEETSLEAGEVEP
jgi:Flp pilus assembly protein CpaB